MDTFPAQCWVIKMMSSCKPPSNAQQACVPKELCIYGTCRPCVGRKPISHSFGIPLVYAYPSGGDLVDVQIPSQVVQSTMLPYTHVTSFTNQFWESSQHTYGK